MAAKHKQHSAEFKAQVAMAALSGDNYLDLFRDPGGTGLRMRRTSNDDQQLETRS